MDYAERLGATAIVSLHINSTGDAQQYGTSGAMAFVPYGQYRPLQAQQTKALAKDMLESLNTELGIRNNGMYTRRSETGDLFPRTKILADYYAIVRHSAIAKIPGFILEHAFVNNPTDCVRYFGNSAKLKALGIADAKAIAKHYNLKLRTDETGWKRRKLLGVYSGGWHETDRMADD